MANLFESRRLALTLLAASAMAIGGCGGEDAETKVPPGDAGPLFAISTIVFTPDLSSRTEHIAFSNSLAQDGVLDEAKSIEITTENSTIWPSHKLGEFFLSDAGTGSIIKYGLGPDGTIEKQGTVGFSAYGATAFYWSLIAVHSPTKALLFDELTLQGFVWNPTEMTISKDVDLSASFNTEEDGKKYTIWRERTPIRIGDKFFAAFKYYDPSSAVSLQRSGMLIMDAAAETFTVVEHPSCSGLFSSVLASDGKIYSATGIVAAAAYFVKQPNATAPCMVRFDPATMKFDDTFKVDLGGLAGAGKFAGGLVAHPGGPVYTRVLIESDAKVLGFTNPLQLSGAPIWETYKLDDVTNPKAATKVSTPNAGGLLYPFEIDGKTYVSDFNLTAGKSFFVDISIDPPERTLQMVDWGYFAVRVR